VNILTSVAVQKTTQNLGIATQFPT